jgi:hypothetical protein
MRCVRVLARGLPAAALAGVLAATAALAQTHGARPAKPSATKPKPTGSAASDNPFDEKSTAPAPGSSAGTSSTPAGTTAADAGPVAAPVSESTPGARLSPLNPAAAEFSDGGAAPPTVDYDRLLSDLASLRARVAAVSDTLFHSRIAISIETSGEASRIASLSVSLDDGVVWTSPAAFRAEDATIIYDHAVAPGNHAVTVDVERRDRATEAFRATQRSRFVVDVPADQRLAVALKLSDDSNMGDFVKDREGHYELHVRAQAKAQATGR